MSTHIVMDTTGDTRHEFDPADPSAVTEAERRFLELKKAGTSRQSGPGTADRNCSDISIPQFTRPSSFPG
jgi:hypothetical protein